MKTIKLMSALMVLIGTQQVMMAEDKTEQNADARKSIAKIKAIKTAAQASDTTYAKTYAESGYVMGDTPSYCKQAVIEAADDALIKCEANNPNDKRTQASCENAKNRLFNLWTKFAASGKKPLLEIAPVVFRSREEKWDENEAEAKKLRQEMRDMEAAAQKRIAASTDKQEKYELGRLIKWEINLAEQYCDDYYDRAANETAQSNCRNCVRKAHEAYTKLFGKPFEK